MFDYVIAGIISAAVGASLAVGAIVIRWYGALYASCSRLLASFLLLVIGMDQRSAYAVNDPHFSVRGLGSLSSSDLQKWNNLKEVDPEIADAARQAVSLGMLTEMTLASKFLSLNDKSYLPALLESAKAAYGKPLVGEIRGTSFRTLEDGVVIVTKGRHVGKSFLNMGEFESFVSRATK